MQRRHSVAATISRFRQLRQHYSDIKSKTLFSYKSGERWEVCLNYPDICFSSSFPITSGNDDEVWARDHLTWYIQGFGLFVFWSLSHQPLLFFPTTEKRKRKRSMYYFLHNQELLGVTLPLIPSLLAPMASLIL